MTKLCECGCGNETPIAKNSNPRCGRVKGQPTRFVHGHNPSRRGLKHGATTGRVISPEYSSFEAAKRRCTRPKNSNYAQYGGRGIQFKFGSFEKFLAELGPRPEGTTLDRYPNKDGHYEPGNVRWATLSEQSKNQRKRRPMSLEMREHFRLTQTKVWAERKRAA